MKMEVRIRGIDRTAVLDAHIARQLHFALGRFSTRIRSVVIYLTDINGPRGGAGYECRVLVQVARRDSIVVEELDHDIFAAVVRATARSGRALARHVRLHRETAAESHPVSGLAH